MDEFLVFESARKWRAWLSRNHDKKKEALLVFFKKHTGKVPMTYEEALGEALCFGWVDGKLKRLDDRKHVIRFTPRRKKSLWSDANKVRAKTLIEEGRMTPAGRAALPESLEVLPKDPLRIPADLADALARNSEAKSFFESLTENYQRMYVGWLTSAKRDETRVRRLGQLLDRLVNKVKPGIT